MKKYFIKTSAFVLTAAILQLAGGFCFQNLSNPPVKVARAATGGSDLASGEMMIGEMSACSEKNSNNYTDIQAGGYLNKYVNGLMKEMTAPAPLAGHRNSLLPCCVNGGHPNVITISQSLELGKLILILSPVPENSLSISIETPVYQAPNISPPELLAIKKTILRL